MGDPMRIRAQALAGRTTVRVLMAHEMESGQRKDSDGQPIAAWFIQTVRCELNDRTVLTAQWGPAVSKNPYLQFVIKGGQAGDRVRIRWVDSRGDSRTDEATVV